MDSFHFERYTLIATQGLIIQHSAGSPYQVVADAYQWIMS